MTIRIGIVGTDNGHAHLFSGWINGWSDDVPIPARPAGYLDSFYLRWAARRTELILESAWGPQRTPIPDVRVTKIWGAVPGEARLIAQACDIDDVTATIAEAVTDVDAVMVLSDLGSDHLEHARLSLEAGLPTYIDKPLAPSAEGARAIADLAAANGARWFSASSLGFSYQVKAARSMIEGLGGLRSMQTKVQNRWADYGIHSFEMAAAFLGRDVKTLRGHTVGTSDIVTLEYRERADSRAPEHRRTVAPELLRNLVLRVGDPFRGHHRLRGDVARADRGVRRHGSRRRPGAGVPGGGDPVDRGGQRWTAGAGDRRRRRVGAVCSLADPPHRRGG